MIYYYISYGYYKLNNKEQSLKAASEGENASSLYCFPHRIEDYQVLKFIVSNEFLINDVADEFTDRNKYAMANYYLGCLLYDKRLYDKAIECFEITSELKPEFPTAHRNLALAYYNVRMDSEKARAELELAFNLDRTDSRVFMEFDQLKRKLDEPVEERLGFMKEHMSLVEDRDDMYLEYVTALNTLGIHKEALKEIERRQFHTWEGGEGKISAQYIMALFKLAEEAMKNKDYEAAKALLLRAADEYPHNLGEGKLESAQENNIYYYLGLVYEALSDTKTAEACLKKASEGISEPAGMMYYNDQPPETIFYQGLAHDKAGNKEEAKARFNKLVTYGKQHLDDIVKIDYFAVSLPDLLIFDENLTVRNKKHCLFMMALGYLGLGMTEEYEENKKKLLDLDSAHQGIKLISACF